MKKYLELILIVYLALGCACSQKTKKGAEVEVIDAIEFVHNTITPIYPGNKLTLKEILSIATEDEEGNIIIYRPGRYAVDDRENIFICDYQEASILVFDQAGNLMRKIGKKGEGPGEFQNIGRIALLPDNRLMVLDWEAHRTSLFDPEGKFINSHQWKSWSYELFFVTNSFYVKDVNIFGPERKLLINAYDLSGNELFSYGGFTPHQSQEVNEAGRRFSFSSLFDVRSILAGDQKNQRLYHCLNDKYVIEVYDREGKLFRKIDRPYDLPRVTKEDVDNYYAGFANSSDTDLALIKKNAKIPDSKTVTDRMLVDDLGKLWVETNETKAEGGETLTAYDIFDSDGFYDTRIWLALAPGLIKKAKMYRWHTDEETGIRTLKVYRFIWNKKDN